MSGAGFVLRTPRLELRELRVEDADEFFALNADPEVLRHVPDPPFDSPGGAREFLANYREYERHGMGRWAVQRSEDGAWLGWCGLKREPALGEVDLGFRLHRRFWGVGYATEAARACCALGFGELGLSRIVGRAAVDNAASIAVLRKCGMRFVERRLQHGLLAEVYELLPTPGVTKP